MSAKLNFLLFRALVQNLLSFLTSSAYHVLLSNVTLHIAVGVFVLKELGEGGVLSVSIQSHHVLVVTTQLGQSHAVRLPRGNLMTRGQTDNQSISFYYVIHRLLADL